MAFYVPLDIFRKMSTVFHVILSNSILIIYVIATGKKIYICLCLHLQIKKSCENQLFLLISKFFLQSSAIKGMASLNLERCMNIPDDFEGYDKKLFCIPKHYEACVGNVLIPAGVIQVFKKNNNNKLTRIVDFLSFFTHEKE